MKKLVLTAAAAALLSTPATAAGDDYCKLFAEFGGSFALAQARGFTQEEVLEVLEGTEEQLRTLSILVEIVYATEPPAGISPELYQQVTIMSINKYCRENFLEFMLVLGVAS